MLLHLLEAMNLDKNGQESLQIYVVLTSLNLFKSALVL